LFIFRKSLSLAAADLADLYQLVVGVPGEDVPAAAEQVAGGIIGVALPTCIEGRVRVRAASGGIGGGDACPAVADEYPETQGRIIPPLRFGSLFAVYAQSYLCTIGKVTNLLR
jgi:hypothetical protein